MPGFTSVSKGESSFGEETEPYPHPNAFYKTSHILKTQLNKALLNTGRDPRCSVSGMGPCTFKFLYIYMSSLNNLKFDFESPFADKKQKLYKVKQCDPNPSLPGIRAAI